MTVYFATLGNEVAPVALGYLVAAARASEKITQVHLLLEKPTPDHDWMQIRWRNLGRWLRIKNPDLKIVWHVAPEEIKNTSTRVCEALKQITEDQTVIANITGGNKVLSLLTWQALRFRSKTQVFAIDSHGAGVCVHDHSTHDQKNPNATTQHEGLNIEDCEKLYLSDDVLSDLNIKKVKPTQEELELSQKIGLPTFLMLEIQKQRCAVFAKHNHLHVVDLCPQKQDSNFTDLSVLRDHATMVGGSLAVPVYRAASDLETSKLENLRVRVQAPNLRGLLIENDQLAMPTSLEPPPTEHAQAEESTNAESPVLVSVVGAQPMPTWITFQHMNPRPSKVFLIATQETLPVAGRLKNLLEGFSVPAQIFSSANTNNPQSAHEIMQNILLACPTQDIHLNLNGGTTSLALETWRAALEAFEKKCQIVKAQYVDRFVSLAMPNKPQDEALEATSRPPALTVAQHMKLHGAEPKTDPEKSTVLYDEEMEQLARTYIANPAKDFPRNEMQNEERNPEGFKFTQAWETKFLAGKPTGGTVLEYLVFCEVYLAVNEPEKRDKLRHAKVLWGGQIYPQQWNHPHGDGKIRVGNNTNWLCHEVDVIVQCDGQNYLIEVKPTIESAVGSIHHEQVDTALIATHALGRYGRTVLIAKNVGDLSEEQYRDATKRKGAHDWVSMFVLEPEPQWPNIGKFPEDFVKMLERK